LIFGRYRLVERAGERADARGTGRHY
jgi:hypothetical protein